MNEEIKSTADTINRMVDDTKKRIDLLKEQHKTYRFVSERCVKEKDEKIAELEKDYNEVRKESLEFNDLSQKYANEIRYLKTALETSKRNYIEYIGETENDLKIKLSISENFGNELEKENVKFRAELKEKDEYIEKVKKSSLIIINGKQKYYTQQANEFKDIKFENEQHRVYKIASERCIKEKDKEIAELESALETAKRQYVEYIDKKDKRIEALTNVIKNTKITTDEDFVELEFEYDKLKTELVAIKERFEEYRLRGYAVQEDIDYLLKGEK